MQVSTLIIWSLVFFGIPTIMALYLPDVGKTFIRVVERISEFFGELSKYMVIITVVTGFANVVLRYTGQLLGLKLVNNAIIEMQWYMYTLIFLFGFAYILKHQINVRVDFWFAEQSKQRKAMIDLVGHFLALIPYCVLAFMVTWPAVVTSFRQWEVSPDPNGLARAPIKAMVLVAFGTLLLQAMAEVIKLFAALRNEEDKFGIKLADMDAPIRVE
ncbi:MAG: TRAP transporter small permease subunit [Candidatus Promineifilaceae bacterium]